MSVFIFDTETTGLVHRSKPYSDPEQPWPVQIAGVLYDDNMDIIETWETLVKLPKGVLIQAKAAAVHGITHDDLEAHGISPQDALEQYRSYVLRADFITTYNLAFDKGVMCCLANRVLGLEGKEAEDYILPKPHNCTMNFCRDQFKVMAKNGTYRPVKLAEAYRRLHGVEMSEVYQAHDAMEDVYATGDVLKQLLISVANK